MAGEKVHKYTTEDGPLKQLDWEKNCALFALSKVLGKSTGDLAKEIVDGGLGGVTAIRQLENPTKIKAVLEAMDFKPVVEDWDAQRHSDEWSEMKRHIHAKRVKSRPLTGRLFGIWWRNKSKKWNDADVPPGQSDHAFTILANGQDIELPATNMADFDRGRPRDDDSVSVWYPPADKLKAAPRHPVLPAGARRQQYV